MTEGVAKHKHTYLSLHRNQHPPIMPAPTKEDEPAKTTKTTQRRPWPHKLPSWTLTAPVLSLPTFTSHHVPA